MVEYGIEFRDKNDKDGLHSMPSILLTVQGNKESIFEIVEYLQKEFELVKFYERKARLYEEKR